MFYASGTNNRKRKNKDKNNHDIIKHIPLHITVTKQGSNIKCNGKVNDSMLNGPDLRTAKIIHSNIRSNGMTTAKMVSQAIVIKSLNTNSITDVLQNVDQSAESVMLFCMNMMQSQDVVIMSIKRLLCKDMGLEIPTESDLSINRLSYKKDTNLAITSKTSQGKKSHENICLLLPYIRAISDVMQLTGKKRIRASTPTQIIHEPSSSTKLILVQANIQSIMVLYDDNKSNSVTLSNEVTTSIKQKCIGLEDLFMPISSEYQSTRCLHIVNKMLMEFVKIFFVLKDKSITNHKIVPSLCFHNWHFRNFTQGYILKCLLKNGQVSVLNIMRNLYFIIITRYTSCSKIDILFRLQVFNDSQSENEYIQQVIINKDSIDVLHNMSYSGEATKDEIIDDTLCMSVSESKESGCCSYSSSSYSLPDYPSQSTLFIEEEIKSWKVLSEETPESITKDDGFRNSDDKQNLNDIYVKFCSNIYQLTTVLYNLKCNTSDIVQCYTADIFSKYDVFNESLFDSKSFDVLFNKDARKFGTTFLITLGKSLAYTMFSYVL